MARNWSALAASAVIGFGASGQTAPGAAGGGAAAAPASAASGASGAVRADANDDIQRVEVLRGPQGALYGSASLGGAVRYLFAKPDLREQGFSILTGASSVSHGGSGYNVDTMANLVLSRDVAALRVVLTKRKDPGYIDNVETGKKDINANNAESARLILALKPTSAFDLTATYATQQSKQGGDGGLSPSPDVLTIDAPTDARILSKFNLSTVQANWEVAGASRSRPAWSTSCRAKAARSSRCPIPKVWTSTRTCNGCRTARACSP